MPRIWIGPSFAVFQSRQGATAGTLDVPACWLEVKNTLFAGLGCRFGFVGTDYGDAGLGRSRMPTVTGRKRCRSGVGHPFTERKQKICPEEFPPTTTPRPMRE
jgi:hypothetical protein